MKRPLHKILFRLLLVLVPVMLALVPARAQQGVDTIMAGNSLQWVIQEFEGVSYNWELYNTAAGINFATDPGNCPPTQAYFVGGVNTGDSVEVMFLLPGIYFLKVTGTDTCSNNLKVAKIIVQESLSVANFLEPEPVCSGDTAWLTLEITGGMGPWDVTFTDGTNFWTIEDITATPYTFQLIPTPTVAGTYQYWVTEVVSGTGFVNNEPGESVTLIVKPKPVTSPIYRYSP